MEYFFKCKKCGCFSMNMRMTEDTSKAKCPTCNEECERDYNNINVNVATCFNGSYNSTRK